MLPNIDQVLKIKQESQKELLHLAGVQGVGVGYKQVDGKRTDEPSIIFLVEKKISEIEQKLLLPANVNGITTDVIAYQPNNSAFNFDEEPDAPAATFDPRFYFPLQGGCRIYSDGNANGFGGTLGMLLQGPNGPVLLSNSHVLGSADAAVYHPDKATEPIAKVLAGTYGDSAIAALTNDVPFKNWIIEVGLIQGAYTIPGSALDYRLKKRGCFTGLTQCHIGISNLVRLDKDGETGVETFLVYGTNGAFHTGDSGSVLVDDYNRVCGLIFQGFNTEGDIAEAIPIEPILSSLKCSILKTGQGRLYGVYKGTNPQDWAYSVDSNESLSLFKEPTLIGVNQDIPPKFISAPPIVVNFKKLNTGSSSYSPRQVTQNLYCLFNIEPGNYIGCSTFDGRSWSLLNRLTEPFLDIKTNCAPAAVEYRSKLYIIRTSSSGNLKCAIFDGNSITKDFTIDPPIQALYDPGLVVADGLLYCFYTPTNSPLQINVAIYDSQTGAWINGPLSVQSGVHAANAYSTCAAVTFKGRLYCFRQGPNNRVYYNVRNNDIWTDDQCIPNWDVPHTASAVKAFVYFNTLFVAYQMPGVPYLEMFCTEDGRNWDTIDYSNWMTAGGADFAMFPNQKIDIASTGGYGPDDNRLYAITESTDYYANNKLWSVNLNEGNTWQQNYPKEAPASFMMIAASAGNNGKIIGIDKPLSSWSLNLAQPTQWVQNSPNINNFVRDLAGGPLGSLTYVSPFGQVYFSSHIDEPELTSTGDSAWGVMCAQPIHMLAARYFSIDSDGNFQSFNSLTAFPYNPAKAIALLDSSPDHGPAIVYVAAADNQIYWLRLGTTIWNQLTNLPARFSIVKLAVTQDELFAIDAFGNIYSIRGDLPGRNWSRYPSPA